MKRKLTNEERAMSKAIAGAFILAAEECEEAAEAIERDTGINGEAGSALLKMAARFREWAVAEEARARS